MLFRILASALSIFILNAFVFPIWNHYREWKHGPREIVARRNWRGHYVPDLTIIRFERALKWSVVLFYLFGVFVLGVIYFG